MKTSGVAVALIVGSLAAVGGLTATASTTSTTQPPPSTTQAVSTGQPGEALDLGLAPVTLLAPATTGAGDRPAFRWEAVEGAASYALAVVTAADEPLWAWQGAAAEVILGGWSTPPPADAFGPLLLGDGKWFVVAFDAGGLPIANSVIRPVAP
jgi:hypothetical protein